LVELSIVTPVLNDRESVGEFSERIKSILQHEGISWEVIFVLDPSSDGTREELMRIVSSFPNFKLIELSRRFGQSHATLAGISKASGSCVIVMDVDLQDPPEIVPHMIREWRAGAKVVLPRRRVRSGEPWTKVMTARLGYKFLSRFSDVPIPENVGDFRLMDRVVVNHLMEFPESTRFLRGLVSLVGFDHVFIDFERPPRPNGETKYNKWFGSINAGMNGVLGFSTAFLRLTTYLGIAVSFIAFLLAISYALAKILGANFPIGNTSIVVLVLFLGGTNLVSLGIVGSYVGRIYEEVKHRPRFIIKDEIGF
jgi:glycosyltransferase involved in cell wall biosynthesis